MDTAQVDPSTYCQLLEETGDAESCGRIVACKAYLACRRRGGERRSSLPDFYIGARAAIRGYRLLSRDRGGYVTHFPQLALISPH